MSVNVPKQVLITGASSGLGRGLAGWYASRGSTVYAAARRMNALETLQQEFGANIKPLALDVAEADATHARVQQLDAECGGLDLVIANAGVGNDVSGKQVDWPRVHHMVKVNVSGAVATLCGALPGMVERQRGHLVGISSLAGLMALPKAATYSASKAFLAMWLDSLRLDLQGQGIAVTAILPGFVKSEMTAKSKARAMPFLLETDDAVDRMGRAIQRRVKTFAFPWQTAMAISAAAALPRSVRDAIMYRMRG